MNEVATRGPAVVAPTEESQDWVDPKPQITFTQDCCDCCWSSLVGTELLHLYSKASGLPIWFLYASLSCAPCQIQHLMRYNYGIKGNDWVDDAIYPTLFVCLGAGTCWSYFKTRVFRSQVRTGRPAIFEST